MNPVALRVILKHGGGTELLLPPEEANHILEAWKVGTLKPVIGGVTVDNVPWGLKVEDVSLFVIVPVEVKEKPQHVQQTVPPFGNTVKFPTK